MFTRTLNLRQFLRSVYGTEPFRDYCDRLGIAFPQIIGFPMHDEDFARWLDALKMLPSPVHAKVELELAKVNEMADGDSLALLAASVPTGGLPSDSIPSGTPEALWFFLRHPDLYQEVFLRQEISEVDAWRTAWVRAGFALDDLNSKCVALAESLKEFFRIGEGSGRFCVVEDHRLDQAYCFICHLSDRLQLLEVFTSDGEHTTQAARPAFPILFVYYPEDGRLILKTRHRARDKILDLLQRFGRTVLGIKLDERCLAPTFSLDLFKQPFDPLPDAADMESVKVKSLHLSYPGSLRRRRLKLETHSNDHKNAIMDLLRQHGGNEQLLDQLRVQYAELLVRLRLPGGSKNYSIRLWPDRCSLNESPLGQRLNSCLRRWGIAHAE